MTPHAPPPLRGVVRAAIAVAVATVVTVARPVPAGEIRGLLHGLTAPVRALHHKQPPICKDDAVVRLADEIDWLKAHLAAHGTIVAKQPDVWGQNRLTRARAEYEEQMRAQLGGFQELSNASLRRSDQAFLGLAMALTTTPPAARGAATAAKPADATASVTNLISNPVAGTAAEMVIARTPPFAATAEPFATFGLGAANAVSLEPTIHLDHLSHYLNHLAELRRINEGDDIADAPGYALNLVRIPVSITPGQHTQAGHGAEITVTADLQLSDELLPTTFRNLVLNDLVDLLAPGLTFAVNSTAVRNALESPADVPLGSAALLGIRSRSVSVPTAKVRRARLPLPPEQMVDVIGERQVVTLLRSTHEALGADPANIPCIAYPQVRGFLGEELQAAYDFLAEPRQQHVWSELPAWNLAELVRSRRINELELRRRAFFDSLGIDPAVPDDPLPFGSAGPVGPAGGADCEPGSDAAAACLEPCANARPARRICRTTTAVLAWAILVEAALLDERLAADMREHAAATGRLLPPAACGSGPFSGPGPSPEARAAFQEYVRHRWPIRVFALDPVSDEQNVEDQSAQRREMQVAMALAVASGRANGQALARYARRLETDLATIGLNKTAVGFTHGSNTFGWRFYPRIQPPPTRGNLAAFADTLCGSAPAVRDLGSRRLDPGMRECTAIVVMPSFVPFVTFDVTTSWFSLTHPRAAEPSMRQAVLLSRSVQAMQATASRCCEGPGGCHDPALARMLRHIDQLGDALPLQSMVAQIPHENTAGGFELFNTGITDLAPELIGWFGAQGVDRNGTTVLFLAGKGFSVHDTTVIAGGRPVKATLLSRQLLRAEIPPGVQTISPAQQGRGGCACGTAARRRPAPTIRLAGNTEPLPAPSSPTLRLSLPPLDAATTTDAGPPPEPCGCVVDCHARELVDVHLATPYGVSGRLLIPVAGSGGDAAATDRCALAFSSGNVVRLTATQTKAGTWRVNEFFESAPDVIGISAPSVFAAPARATIAFTLRDTASGTTAGTFSIPALPFDVRTQRYVLTGADLRNFVGDTSRPATDKTLRGTVKPYLDSLGTGTTADGVSVVNRDLALTAALVTDQKTIPIEGGITVTVRENNQAADPVTPAP